MMERPYCFEGLEGQSKATNEILKATASQRLSHGLSYVKGDATKQPSQVVHEVTAEACKCGARVVLWFRREDITSTDPDDGQGEIGMLEHLNKNPYIVYLHMILPDHS